MELADENQKSKLTHFFSNNSEIEQKVESVKKIFNNLNIPLETTILMKEYHKKAISHLDSINSESKKPLYMFSELLLERTS